MASPDTYRNLCYDSLGEFYLALYLNYDYVDFQQERIVPALEAVERGDLDRLMIFLPSGHAKTELATKSFIPWYLGRNPNKNVILICHTDPLAKDFGGHIRDTMSNNEVYNSVFPKLKINSLNRASNFFRTNTGNAFYAFGMDGGVTGRRGDLLVIDDPIRNLQDALSDTVQNDLFSTYNAVLKDRMRPDSRIIMAMTRWAVRDLAGRILEAEGKRWKVLVLKAEDDNEAGEPSGRFLWESFYGKERYLEAKEDAYIWAAKWQQSPKPQLNQGFQEEWLRFYVPKYDSQGRERQVEWRKDADGNPTTILSQPVDYDNLFRFNTYILVDPAMGKEAAHDRTCILVLAAGPENRFFLVDAVLDRIDAVERIDHIVRLARMWHSKQVVYEEYALAADTLFLKIKLEAEGMDELSVISVGRKAIKGMTGGRLKKHDRLMQLIPDFRDGRIWLPKRMMRKCLDGSEIDIIGYFITKEYLPYAGEGSIAHEDMLDCLSRIRDPEFFPIFATRERDDDEFLDAGYTHGGSWEANF
jgi:hypothetical protein